jgi:hypothetical protein
MSTSTDGSVRAPESKFQQERWSLHVEFDPPGKDDGGRDETVMFMMHVARTFGGLWEELREILSHEIGTTKVEISTDEMNYLADLMGWVMFHTIPREAKLIRNHGRRR